MGARQFGARVARLEDPALLTGAGRFVDDVKLPGALHACFVRSPHAHARIRSIDATAALAMPGVHAVLTADDLPEPMRSERIPNLMTNPAIKIMRTQHALAREEVCYVGEAVAVVIADSRYVAEDAAALVEVDYDVLPAVCDCRDAVKPGAPRAHSDIEDNVAGVRAHGVSATWTRRSRARRTCSRNACGCTAAAAWRWKPAPSRRATIRRAISSPSGRRPRRRISAAACSPTCSAAISKRSA